MNLQGAPDYSNQTPTIGPVFTFREALKRQQAVRSNGKKTHAIMAEFAQNSLSRTINLV
jgi:hypothetical protein